MLDSKRIFATGQIDAALICSLCKERVARPPLVVIPSATSGIVSPQISSVRSSSSTNTSKSTGPRTFPESSASNQPRLIPRPKTERLLSVRQTPSVGCGNTKLSGSDALPIASRGCHLSHSSRGDLESSNRWPVAARDPGESGVARATPPAAIVESVSASNSNPCKPKRRSIPLLLQNRVFSRISERYSG
jgi:hypothetical protein